jgi:hypothetical protein
MFEWLGITAHDAFAFIALFLVLYRLEVIISLLRDTKNERHDND